MISTERYQERLTAARDSVSASGDAAMLVGVGPELEWLTGYAAHGLERLNLLIIPAHGEISLVCPRLESSAAR